VTYIISKTNAQQDILLGVFSSYFADSKNKMVWSL